MADETEREELQELVQTPGWRRVIAYAEQTYGPASLARLARTLAESDRSASDVGHDLRYAASSMKALGIVLGWPQERLARLDAQEERH